MDILRVIFWVFIILVLYLSYRLLIKPYMELLWYKKQGIPIYYFFPLLGFAKMISDSFKKHGDALFCLKVMKHKNQSQQIYSLNLGTSVFLFIVDPALIKECLLCPEKFVKHQNPCENLSRFFGQENIIISEGKDWKISRKIISNSFNFTFLKESIPIITSFSKKKFESLLNMEDVDLKKELEILILEILTEIFFHKDSVKLLCEGKPLANMITDITNRLNQQTMEFPYLLFGRKFYELGLRNKDRRLNEDMNKVKEIINDFVDDQRGSKLYLNNNSLLSNLLKNEEILKSEGLDVSSRIRNEILTLFFA